MAVGFGLEIRDSTAQKWHGIETSYFSTQKECLKSKIKYSNKLQFEWREGEKACHGSFYAVDYYSVSKEKKGRKSEIILR